MKKSLFIFSLLMVLVLMAACGSSENSGATGEGNNGKEGNEADSDFSPGETVDWTIAFGPGGGNDVMARTMISIIDQHDLYPGNIMPENRQGGSGAVGWGYLKGQAGNPYAISTTSGSFITTPLQSDAGFTYDDFTHIALMATDDMLLVVPGDSEFDTLEEFIEHAKGNNVNFGGVGVANVSRMIIARLVEETGIENYEYVPYDDAGLVLSDMLAGTLDATLSNPGHVVGQLQAGELKALAFSGKDRLPNEYAEIPTFLEAGYDVNVSMPRGVILPPDVSDEVRDYWIDMMKQVAETPEWKEYIESNGLSEQILYGDDFTEYLQETTEIFDRILDELGITEG